MKKVINMTAKELDSLTGIEALEANKIIEAEMEIIQADYPELNDDDFCDASQNANLESDDTSFLSLFGASCEGIKMELNK